VIATTEERRGGTSTPTLSLISAIMEDVEFLKMLTVFSKIII
jgi:hypothetical protein